MSTASEPLAEVPTRIRGDDMRKAASPSLISKGSGPLVGIL